MFIIYCLETVIIGIFNVVKMVIVSIVKKRDVWSNGTSQTMMPGWFFVFFFILHYGFFVAVQMGLFFSITSIVPAVQNPLQLFTVLPDLLDNYTKAVLLVFIGSYIIQIIYNFILPKTYLEISLSRLMFSPYMRIIIQQFVVILGSIILGLGGGKIFMLVFVSVKIYFEVFLNYDRMLNLAEKRQRIKDNIGESGK